MTHEKAAANGYKLGGMTARDDFRASVSDQLHGSTLSYSLAGEALASPPVPMLTILAHPDPSRVGARAVLSGLHLGEPVALSRLQPTFAVPGRGGSRPLADGRLSRRPLRLECDPIGGLVLNRDDIRTPILIDGEPFADRQRFSDEALRSGVILVLAERIALLLHLSERLPGRSNHDFGLVGESGGIDRLRRQIEEAAPHEAPILLRGETGTGKELVAHALHNASKRRSRPLVTVNVGGLSPQLAAAELFGAERGAFTGADRSRRGLFRRAHGGTLFLDEIGEAPPDVQVLLLRALENHEIQPVGADRPVSVDVRVIAATDAALEQAVDAGTFRSPLLHRLAGYEIRLPSLRERRDDIGRLLVHFLRIELESVGATHRLEPPGRRDDAWLNPVLVATLTRAPWSGNVRQLRNVARHLVIAQRRRPRLTLTPELRSLLEETESCAPTVPIARPKASTEVDQPTDRVLDDDRLLATMRRHRFRVRATAAELGVSPTTLYQRIERSDRIRKAGDLSSTEIEQCRVHHDGDLDAMAEALEVSRKGLRRRMTDLGFG